MQTILSVGPEIQQGHRGINICWMGAISWTCYRQEDASYVTVLNTQCAWSDREALRLRGLCKVYQVGL